MREAIGYSLGTDVVDQFRGPATVDIDRIGTTIKPSARTYHHCDAGT